MSYDGDCSTILWAQSIFLLDIREELAFVYFLLRTFLSDRHNIRFVSHCQSLVQIFCKSANV